MYMDMDSILFSAGEAKKKDEGRWFSSVEGRELSREDILVLYGCWADDAARCGVLSPVHGH